MVLDLLKDDEQVASDDDDSEINSNDEGSDLEELDVDEECSDEE